MVSLASPVSDLVCCSRLTAVVDIGAMAVDGEPPPYQEMLQSGLCTVTGFEPHPEALAELHRQKGPLETYLPHVVGDGETHRLMVTVRGSGMTSLLRPDTKRLALFNGFTEWGAVIDEIEVATHRLDDIDELGEFDLLKIDIQGGELMTFQNGRRKLADAVAVQTEVSFVPLYKNQPVFGQVDLELRSQGFLPHSFRQSSDGLLHRRCSAVTSGPARTSCSRRTSFTCVISLIRNASPTSSYRIWQ
jgi:FkbM family methyltransferase